MCGEGGREELEISRVNTQRDRKLEKIAHSAERFSDHGVERSGNSERGMGYAVSWWGYPGFRSE